MSETIADIIREMREQGKYNKENSDLDWTVEEVGDLQLRLADRIEAAREREVADALDTGAFVAEAHKREPITNCNGLNTKPAENVNSEKVIYNGGKIREALLEVKRVLKYLYKPEIAPMDGDNRHILKAEAILETALAEPSEPIGNNAKLREALKYVAEQIQDEAKWADEMSYQQALALGIIQSALAEPARNCDVGTPAEQQIRFAKFCLYTEKTCDTCPAAKMGYEKGVKCSFVWGQMPYTEGETK